MKELFFKLANYPQEGQPTRVDIAIELEYNSEGKVVDVRKLVGDEYISILYREEE